MSSAADPRHAFLELPSWFWNGNPAGLLAEAGVEVRRDRTDGRWTVQTAESYRRQAPSLITYRQIAGPGVHRENFSYLSRQEEAAVHTPGDQVHEELARRERRLQQTRNPVHALELIRLHTLVSDTGALGRVAEDHFRDLLEVPLESDPTVKVFTNAGVHLIERSPALIWRLKVPMILSQIAQDRRVQEGDIAHLIATGSDGGLAFRSAGGLSDGIYLMDAYVGPLLGALAPSVWCMTVPRSFGVLFYSLGQPMAGNTGSAEEMLHIIGGPGADRSLPVPHLSPTASHSALKWWANALNRMFAVLSDFAVFTGSDGTYRADKHMHAILTMEQLFRRTSSALTADRDTNARRVLMFTALDTVERLTTIKLEKMASPAYAETVVRRIEDLMPPRAAEVLLPSAARSVDALQELGEGFFVRQLLGEEDLHLHYGDGTVKAMSQDDATAFFVKALRDATHGHGSNKASARDRTTALLAQHDGHIPHDLGLIVLLYLLDLLAHPERLRAVLRSWCASP